MDIKISYIYFNKIYNFIIINYYKKNKNKNKDKKKKKKKKKKNKNKK